MCTEHLTDSVGEVVDLVDAVSNILMGEGTHTAPVDCDLRRSLLVRVFKTGEGCDERTRLSGRHR